MLVIYAAVLVTLHHTASTYPAIMHLAAGNEEMWSAGGSQGQGAPRESSLAALGSTLAAQTVSFSLCCMSEVRTSAWVTVAGHK